MTNMLKMHQEALEAVLDRESASKARHDAKIDELEAKLLAKMSLISSLELTLSNSTNLNVMQMGRIEALEARDTTYIMGVMAHEQYRKDVEKERQGFIATIKFQDEQIEGWKRKYYNSPPAAPTEPTPEESK